MKSVNIIPVVLIALSSLTTTAQDQAKIPEGISLAIKAGNAGELSKYMNSTIELLLLDKEDFYKKSVADHGPVFVARERRQFGPEVIGHPTDDSQAPGIDAAYPMPRPERSRAPAEEVDYGELHGRPLGLLRRHRRATARGPRTRPCDRTRGGRALRAGLARSPSRARSSASPAGRRASRSCVSMSGRAIRPPRSTSCRWRSDMLNRRMRALAGLTLAMTVVLGASVPVGAVGLPSQERTPALAQALSSCADAVTSAPTGPATVSTASTAFGKVLVIGSGTYAGCSLYLLTSDRLHVLTTGAEPYACSDNSNPIGLPCDSVLWPALLTHGAPIAGPGVNPALLGTVTRTDLPGMSAVQQVTYAGQPLYRFFLDEAPGETEGANLFDPVTSPTGIWYLVEPRRGRPAPGQARVQVESAPIGGTDPTRTYWPW